MSNPNYIVHLNANRLLSIARTKGSRFNLSYVVQSPAHKCVYLKGNNTQTKQNAYAHPQTPYNNKNTYKKNGLAIHSLLPLLAQGQSSVSNCVVRLLSSTKPSIHTHSKHPHIPPQCSHILQQLNISWSHTHTFYPTTGINGKRKVARWLCVLDENHFLSLNLKNGSPIHPSDQRNQPSLKYLLALVCVCVNTHLCFRFNCVWRKMNRE